MDSKEQIKKDLETLRIDESQDITKQYVTAKYKSLAKEIHPDRPGGVTSEFQELLNAYRRIIKHLEEKNEEDEEIKEEDYETEFFKKHNFMNKCSSSYVVYIEEKFVERWRKVLDRHIVFQKMDKIRVIYKTGDITITLYQKPKKDPRSKLHIQSGDQGKNLDFILEKLSMFYREVCQTQENTSIDFKELHRSQCGKCGKSFTNKRGVKQHIMRMHSSINKKMRSSQSKPDDKVITLEEHVDVATPPTGPHNPEPEIPKENLDKEGNTQIMEDLVVEFVNNAALQSETNLYIEELLKETTDEIESNFQCGICGKLFDYEKEVTQHMEETHGCDKCDIYEEKKQVLEHQISEKENEITRMKEINKNIIIKNVYSDKENKRLKLALKQSETEKVKIKIEIQSMRESLHAALRENTVLNETIKLKDLLENNKELYPKENENPEEEAEDEEVIIDEGNVKNKQKCAECAYETSVPKHIKSHKIKHTGQYFCPQCKAAMKTLASLDEHIKIKHGKIQSQQKISYTCEICEEAFSEKHRLRQHVSKNHMKSQPIRCDQCGDTFCNTETKNKHMKECTVGFETVNPQLCRYYAKLFEGKIL